MAVIKWKECYETKIKVLDNEHQRLVIQINRLFEAIRNKDSETVLLPIFDELVDYTEKHFAHEEAILAEYKYPDLPAQQQEHEDLTRQVIGYRKKLEEGSSVSAAEVMKFLRSWLLDHIVNHDLQYGPYLESRAGRFIQLTDTGNTPS